MYARGHEFHIFTIWVQNWVLCLKLSHTNFHVSTFISSRVISVWIFAPVLAPVEIYDVMQGDMNFTFSLYESRIEFCLKLSQCTNFHVSTFISSHVISVWIFAPVFDPKVDLCHARGHEFHIFTIWVQNWVLRLKLSQCTNFHVSTFISSRVISVWIFAPVLAPVEIYDVMQGDMNFTFSLYESRIEFSV